MVGELAALSSAALWALSGVVIKDVTGRLSAFYIMAVRTSVSAVLALSIFLVVGADWSILSLPASTLLLLVVSQLYRLVTVDLSRFLLHHMVRSSVNHGNGNQSPVHVNARLPKLFSD